MELTFRIEMDLSFQKWNQTVDMSIDVTGLISHSL